MSALPSIRDGMIAALSNCARPAPSINIVPSVFDWGRQSSARLDALARAASRISDAVYGGQMYAQMLSPADFAALKDFVRYADGEFALIGAGFRRDDKPDEQHSPDGYSHHLDREKM